MTDEQCNAIIQRLDRLIELLTPKPMVEDEAGKVIFKVLTETFPRRSEPGSQKRNNSEQENP